MADRSLWQLAALISKAFVLTASATAFVLSLALLAIAFV